jgi:hypothetical protein
MRRMDDKARRDNADVLLTITDALVENGLLNKGKGDEGDEDGGPDVHRGRIRDVDDVDDGAKCKNDDDDEEDEDDDDDDARRRIIPALADAAELIAKSAFRSPSFNDRITVRFSRLDKYRFT